MKIYLIILIVIVSFVALSGCEPGGATPPSSSFADRSMVDYSFIDISSSCILYNNINISNETTPCILPKKETFMFYTEENNWSIMCCEFDSKCITDNSNTTAFDELCEDNNDGSYNGYVFNDQGFWMAQCCNENGGACYVDTMINVSDPTSVCDEDYHENSYSIDYNGTSWNAMCCIGGLEE